MSDIDILAQSYTDILSHLPSINGKKPTSIPMGLNEIASMRMDSMEIGEIYCQASVEDVIMAPGRELKDYRYRLEQMRRKLVRDETRDLIVKIDQTLLSLKKSTDYIKQGSERVISADWSTLNESIDSLRMAIGKNALDKLLWGTLDRHLRFGQAHDLRDIIDTDWPLLRVSISSMLHGEYDPLTVGVDDLSELVDKKPIGRISSKLAWANLTPDDFERLVFSLISTEAGYENSQWLMHTNASDRGRDLSVDRVQQDSLAGTVRQRVIIQCKHWLTKSVGMTELSVLINQMKLWEPPRVDVHVVASSGRFTADAVAFVDKHNTTDTALRIEMWPDSTLEKILARRPDLIAEHNLR